MTYEARLGCAASRTKGPWHLARGVVVRVCLDRHRLCVCTEFQSFLWSSRHIHGPLFQSNHWFSVSRRFLNHPPLMLIKHVCVWHATLRDVQYRTCSTKTGQGRQLLYPIEIYFSLLSCLLNTLLCFVHRLGLQVPALSYIILYKGMLSLPL